MGDTDRSVKECETDFIDTDTDSGVRGDAGLACPIRITEAGVSFFVPTNIALGPSVIYIGSFSESELTDCEGAKTYFQRTAGSTVCAPRDHRRAVLSS